jgi:hypothetical protein
MKKISASYRNGLVVLTALTVVASAFANEGEAKEDCGEAQVVQGSSCPNVKVKFSFANCKIKSAEQLATSVSCDGKKIVARYESGPYKYEASLNKAEDGWGAVSWKPAKLKDHSNFKETAKAAKKARPVAKAAAAPSVAPNKEVKEPARTVATAPAAVVPQPQPQLQPPPAPAVAAPPVVVPPVESKEVKTEPSPFKFSGFTDFWLTSYSRDARSGASGASESGFALQDGALYLNYQKGPLSYLLDVPFRRFKNADAGNTTDPNSSSNGNVVFGNDKAQAYLKYSSANNFEIVLGQFDTVFGVDVNDSKDRYFSKTGLVYDYMLPVTHAGAMVSYNYNGAYARVLSANSNNKGSLGSSPTGDNNYEYAAVFGFSNERVRLQAGYMARPINKASGSVDGNRNLMDATVGATVGKLSVDLEYAVLADDSKNTLTSADTTDKENNGTGLLLLTSYSLDDTWSLGMRAERLANDPGQLGLSRQDALAFGVHYKWNSSLETRTEWTQYKYQQISQPSIDLSDRRLEISNIFSF